MKEQPLVSIGIPTYKRPDFLKRALSSVLNQTYSNLEVIISENGAKDQQTKELLEQYSSDDPRVRYVLHTKEMPVSDNFKFLLNEAEGQYFAFLADDDYISSNFVSELLQLFLHDPKLAVAFSQYKLVYSNSEQVKCVDYLNTPLLQRLLYFYVKPDDAFFYGLYRKQTLKQVFPLPKWCWPIEDVLAGTAFPMVFHCLLIGRVGFTNKNEVYYYHDSSNEKHYNNASQGTNLWKNFTVIYLSMNTHYNYCKRTLFTKPYILPLVSSLSMISVLIVLVRRVVFLFKVAFRKLFKLT